jgi:hypothetical protein
MKGKIIFFLSLLFGATIVASGCVGEGDACDEKMLMQEGVCLPLLEEELSQLGEACISHAECIKEAPFCMVYNDHPYGYCTTEGCNLEQNDCPEGYACIDLSSDSPGLITVCAWQ